MLVRRKARVPFGGGRSAGRLDGGIARRIVGRIDRRIDRLRLGIAPPDHRQCDVGKEDREKPVELALAEGEGEDAAADRADGGEQLERHPEAQVRHVALEVDRRPPRCSSRSRRSRLTPAASRSGQAEAEGQERHDEDAAAQAQERPEDAGADAGPDHQQPDGHVRPAGGGGRGRSGAAVVTPASGSEVLRRVRQERDVAGPLEGDGQLALVAGAGAGLAARLDLGPLGQVAAEAVDLLVVDLDGLVGAERADLAAAAIAVVVVALLGAGWRGHRWVPVSCRRQNGQVVEVGVVEVVGARRPLAPPAAAGPAGRCPGRRRSVERR